MSLRTSEVHVIDESGRPVTRTSRKQADKYVARGCGRWVGRALQMIAGDYRVIPAAKKSYRDGAGFATLQAIAGLPCVRPQLMLMGKRPAAPPADYPQPAILQRTRLPLSSFELQRPTWPARPIPRSVRVVMADGVEL